MLYKYLFDNCEQLNYYDNIKLNECTIRKHRIQKTMENKLNDNRYPFIPDGPVDTHEKNDRKLFIVKARKCYVCKKRFNELHHFYDSMCTECGNFNYEKRFQERDMTGKYCLVTGGRIKIGFYVALKLLRSNANVIITTRFPNDAILRFSKEKDYDKWKDKLTVFFLNLCNIRETELFCEYLYTKVPKLDVIINNACQTIRREPEYYHNLLKNENNYTLNDDNSKVVERNAQHVYNFNLYPENLVDLNGQQIDLRKNNTWNTKLCDVSTNELAEVFVINSIAPTILSSKLRKMMKHKEDSYIINVSSMEGKFSRHKSKQHPHTNMAKAALNMLTKTCGNDFVEDNIYMTSVDTGWVTNEYPVEIAERIFLENNFIPPLDEIDGASRVLDPIFTNKKEHGVFFKDYTISDW